MSEHKWAEAPKNSHKNKATAWTDFKNFFAWLTGMKKIISYFYDFFGSGHFLVIFLDIMGQKNDPSQKSHWSKK